MNPDLFDVGDLVTRDGTDVHRVIATNQNGRLLQHVDLIHVECVKAPLGYLNEDGSRDKPWAEIGETEWNLPWRYSRVGIEIDATAIVALSATPLPDAVDEIKD